MFAYQQGGTALVVEAFVVSRDLSDNRFTLIRSRSGLDTRRSAQPQSCLRLGALRDDGRFTMAVG
ncbi:MAG: hypothetical protein ABL898_17155, partial [Hyphomicrobiaceae bacterium]